MKTIQELVQGALTEASAPPTKEKQQTIEESQVRDWAEWLKFKTNNDPALENMVKAVREFTLAFKFQHTPRWITFLGDTGTGKSHCGRRLWNHMAARTNWHNARFIQQEIYWPRFVSDLRSGNSFDQLHDMITWPVLFLDDIGAERDTTGFASEQLNMLVGSRENKWTILTSNLFLDQLGGIDPRISDRIIREPNIFVQVKTDSYALRKHSRLPYADT